MYCRQFVVDELKAFDEMSEWNGGVFGLISVKGISDL